MDVLAAEAALLDGFVDDIAGGHGAAGYVQPVAFRGGPLEAFALEGHAGAGPYTLHLSLVENRLVFTVGDRENEPIQHVMLSLSPFRRLVKDYFLVCESYYQAIKTQPASKIEAIDMGRRGIHDEGSQLLLERLRGKIAVDIATARRLFTLLCALHWKG